MDVVDDDGEAVVDATVEVIDLIVLLSVDARIVDVAKLSALISMCSCWQRHLVRSVTDAV